MSKWSAFAMVGGRRAAISLSVVAILLAVLGLVVLVSAQVPTVSVVKTASPTEVYREDPVQYTITFTNESDTDQILEVITDTLPADFTYVAMVPGSDIQDGGPPPGSTGTIVWSGFTVNTIPAGGTLSLIYTAVADAPTLGPYDNLVWARLQGGEIVESASATVKLVDVEMDGEKSASVPEVRVGDPLEYEVELTNNGNTTATLTSIVDTLPARFVYDSMVSDPENLGEPDEDGNDLTWAGPIDIAPGGTLVFRYRVIADGTPGNSPSNSLLVTYEGGTLSLSEDVLLLERIFFAYVPLLVRPEAPPPVPYRLAYDSYIGSNFEIAAIDADGSNWLNVSNEAGGDLDPDWSPDGSKLAWVHFYDGKGDIMVSNADGTGKVNLTNHAKEDRAPAWSPDGTKIAFSSFRSDRWEVYVMDADGNNVTRLTDHMCQSHDPVWSPDGSKIAYLCGLDSAAEGISYVDIFVMDANGQSFIRLTHNEVPDEAIDWSPDSKSLAYVHYNGIARKDSEIWIVDVQTATKTQLTFNNSADYSPAWSPDGTKIAFSAYLNGSYDIAVMNADGSNVVDLTNAPMGDFVPRWSPDGTLIAFVSTRDGDGRALYVMNADGTGQTRLDFVANPSDSSVHIPVWQPQ